jgi:hypothetical protein
MCRSSAKVQKRAIFRKQYEGRTLREDLGLAPPKTASLSADDLKMPGFLPSKP